MLISESHLRIRIRKILSELLGAKSKESALQRALGGTSYGGDGYGYYDDYGYDYYDDYGYYGSTSDDDGDDGGDDGGDD